MYLKMQPEPETPAIWERHEHPHDRRRILVVANETVGGRSVLNEVRYRARNYKAKVFVIAPALPSRMQQWTSDVDGSMAAARDRLNRSLATLLAAGIQAEGDIGDSDPLQAMEDACRRFDPDEIIVSTHTPGRSHWLERGIIEKARERYPVPITHVIVDLEHEAQPVPAATT